METDFDGQFWQCTFCSQINISVADQPTQMCSHCGLAVKRHTRVPDDNSHQVVTDDEPQEIENTVSQLSEESNMIPYAEDADGPEQETTHSASNEDDDLEVFNEVLSEMFEEPAKKKSVLPWLISGASIIVIGLVATLVIPFLWGGAPPAANVSPPIEENINQPVEETEEEPVEKLEEIESSEVEDVSLPVWETKIDGSANLIPVTDGVLIVNKNVSILTSAGKLVSEIETESKDVTVVPTKSGTYIITPKKLTFIDQSFNDPITVSLKNSEQVRVLGEEAFIFNEDRAKVSAIVGKKRKNVAKPVEGATPLYGAKKGSKIWAAPGQKIVRVSAAGKKKTVALKAPIKNFKIERWLGADKQHVYVLWGKGKKQAFTIHDVKTGKKVASEEIKNAANASFRKTISGNLAIFQNLLIDTGDGKIKQIDDEFQVEETLSKEFLLMIGDDLVVVDFQDQTVIPDHVNVISKTDDGWLLSSDDGETLSFVKELAQPAQAD